MQSIHIGIGSSHSLFYSPTSVAPDTASSIRRHLADYSPPADRILFNAYHIVLGVTPSAIQSIHGTSIEVRNRSNPPMAHGLPTMHLLASSNVEV
jgi:hypothetical protein